VMECSRRRRPRSPLCPVVYQGLNHGLVALLRCEMERRAAIIDKKIMGG
jgi:hypothetical protein